MTKKQNYEDIFKWYRSLFWIMTVICIVAISGEWYISDIANHEREMKIAFCKQVNDISNITNRCTDALTKYSGKEFEKISQYDWC